MMAEVAAVIAAVFTGISGVILALTKWQAGQIKDLLERVQHLEDSEAENKRRFRDAVRFIRELLAHLRTTGSLATAPPIPESLKEEI